MDLRRWVDCQTKKVPALFLIFVSIFLLTSCASAGDSGDASDSQSIVKEEQKPQYYCPLDNAPLDDLPDRPLLVSIDNYKKARPQSGLSQADIVYEFPAEGGISRFLAVFYHQKVDKIGPVRSARPYLVDMAKEWQGVYVHVGGSPDALDYLSRGSLPYINEFSYGKYFWRDKSRHAPHNLYTDSEKLLTVMQNQGWNEKKTISPLPFWPQGQKMSEGEIADIIKINYPSAKNLYLYNQQTGLYQRQINEQPHLDANNQQQLAAANILVQKVSSKVLDDAGRLKIDLVGQGEAWIFSGGYAQKGNWQKDSLDSPTVFKDQNGKRWNLASGQTWIQVIDQTVKLSYENSQAGSGQ